MPEATRHALTQELLARHVNMNVQPQKPRTATEALVRADQWVGASQWGAGNTAGDWLASLIGTMDASKLVLEFLKAQDNMDLFSNDPVAKRLYNRIIAEGIKAIFKGRDE